VVKPIHSLQGAVQIAGVIDQHEADMLVRLGVGFVGFPLRLRDGREDLSEEEAAAIIRGLAPRAHGVCITYLDEAGEIIELCDRLGVGWLQIHGQISVSAATELKSSRPRLKLIKSLIVREAGFAALTAEIDQFGRLADAFITDTFDPDTGRSGATGLTHDWEISRRIVELSPIPVILAGGLNPGNVAEAIRRVRPAAVDAHTGVEAPDGRKDPALVRQFISEARKGFL
jgi:phosphoribosylanthranilate isomerase